MPEPMGDQWMLLAAAAYWLHISRKLAKHWLHIGCTIGLNSWLQIYWNQYLSFLMI
jgi:hypothetical protein